MLSDAANYLYVVLVAGHFGILARPLPIQHTKTRSAGCTCPCRRSRLAWITSNLAPTNRTLVERVKANVQQLQQENPHAMVPIDLVTTSASGLDPEISPASAEFQVSRIARARHIQEEQLRTLVQRHTKNRDLGFLGEPRVNVLELNLDLDNFHPGS